MPNSRLTCSLVYLFHLLLRDWYYDSSCDGDGTDHHHIYTFEYFTMKYYPHPNNPENFPRHGMVEIDFVENITEEDLHESLHLIEEAIEKDITFINQHFDADYSFTYRVFKEDECDETDWKGVFQFVHSKKIRLFVYPYDFDSDEDYTNYQPFHLYLLGGFDFDKTKKEFNGFYERFCSDISFEEYCRRNYEACSEKYHIYQMEMNDFIQMNQIIYKNMIESIDKKTIRRSDYIEDPEYKEFMKMFGYDSDSDDESS